MGSHGIATVQPSKNQFALRERSFATLIKRESICSANQTREVALGSIAMVHGYFSLCQLNSHWHWHSLASPPPLMLPAL